MELSITDRILLLNLLPPTGDILTLRIVRKLREELSFSEEELAEFELRHLPDKDEVRWTKSKERTKNIEFGPKAQMLVAEELRKKDKEKQLTEQYIDLFNRFVEEDA